MQVGIIGAGAIGSILARRLVEHGHDVLLANSRGPDSLAALAQELGAQAVTAGDAARAADLVIISIPQKSILDLPPGLFAGVEVAVIDTGNYYPFRDGVIGALEHGEPESRWVASQIGRPVVKVFNNIMAPSLASNGKAKGAVGRTALPIAGDDVAAKAKAAEVVELMGFDVVDAGTIAESWRQQPGSPVYCTDWDAAGVRVALAAADWSRLPAIRDLMIQKLFSMPEETTLEERVEAARALFK
jgi:predicted dinucleotide-binding enzyme